MLGIKRKSKFTILEQKKRWSDQRIREWLSKWDRTIAAVTGVIIFCALVALVIVDIKVYNKDDKNGDQLVTSTSGRFSESMKIGTSCNLEGDILVCTGGTLDDLCTKINDFVTSKVTINGLRLEDIQYPDNTIKEGWLSCIEMTPSKLTITGDFQDIAERAFNGPTFSSLKYLTIRTTKGKTFRRNMFEGLRLTNLDIDCGGLGNFEQNVFGAISQFLETLQVVNCINQQGGDVLPNITGSSELLLGLVTLDLSHNELKKITAGSFQSATSVDMLFLSFSGITEIELGAFDNFDPDVLYLNDNNLNTLPDGIFRYLSKGIYINNNDWRCDCDLLWMKYLKRNRPELFASEFICFNELEGYKPYDKVKFCDNDTISTPTTTSPTTATTPAELTNTTGTITSTTTSSPPTTATPTTIRSTSSGPTTIPTTASSLPKPSSPTATPSTTITSTSPTAATTTTTTKPPQPTTTVKCLEPSDFLVITDEIRTNVLSVRNESVRINFYLRNEDTYILQILGSVQFENLLWINSENKADASCVKNVTNGYLAIVDNLEPNKTYMFCLMHPEETGVSPYDCGAMSLPLSDTNTWLTVEDKIAVICGICGGLALAALITGIIVFYCIRQNPSLIKGNKRVIIVESEAAQAIVMPSSYYDEINYKPPSLNSRSGGYLTPTTHGVYSPRPSPHLRTISEHTDFVVIPSTGSGGRYRRASQRRRRTELEFVGRTAEEHLYEPPPLPPNHPSGMIYTDSWRRSHSRI